MGAMKQFQQRRRRHTLGRWISPGWLVPAVSWLCAWSPIAPAQDAAPPGNPGTLQIRLQAEISRPQFAASAWGIQVVSLKTGQTLFEHNAQKLLKPASNAKLYTGALALDRLGPDYQIKTSLYASARPDAAGVLKGDLIVYGRGDPSFAARFNNGDHQKSLEPLVAALEAAGVKRVEGDLVGDASYFHGPPFGASWNWDDLQYYYGAEVSALTVEDNVVDLVFKPGSSVGEPCSFTASPVTTFLTFVNHTKTGAKDSPRKIDLYRPLGENVVFVSGQSPLGGSNHIDAVTVHDPALWFVTLLKEALARRGISISGKLRSSDWLAREKDPADFSKLGELGSVVSRPLREILAKMMKPSQNLYAQLLLLQVGAWSATAEKSVPTSRRDGATATARSLTNQRSPAASSAPAVAEKTTEDLGLAEMQKFLSEVGLKKNEILLEEGSGLSRGCLLTPHATVELLRFMSRHRYADIYRDALPVAGGDGSLRSRLKQTKAAGNVRAKTGSLRYVDTLSGYVTTAAGEPLAFSIMLNNYPGSGNSGRVAIDSLVKLLAEYQGGTGRKAK